MIELDDEWLSFQDFGKAFTILKQGGMLRCGKYGVKLDRNASGLVRLSIVLFGKKLDYKSYISTVTPYAPKKKKKEEKKEPVAFEASDSVEGGLF